MNKASNNQIKLLRKLGQKKYREKEGLFIVEGDRAVEQVLENKVVQVKEIFVDEGKAKSYQLSANSFYEVDSKLMNELSDTDNAQGLLAVCKIPKETSIEELQQENGLIIATDRIQDPGNLGTIVRTGVWFGVAAILLEKGSVDLFHPKVVRSTAGATGCLPYLNANLGEDFKEFEQAGWDILMLDSNSGAEPIDQIKLSEKTILVVGNEANGISHDLITPNRQRVLIPAAEKNRSVESLNAAIAMSIALYQLNR